MRELSATAVNYLRYYCIAAARYGIVETGRVRSIHHHWVLLGSRPPVETSEIEEQLSGVSLPTQHSSREARYASARQSATCSVVNQEENTGFERRLFSRRWGILSPSCT